MTEEYNRLPLIGDKAPAFQALTTNGTIHFPEDYEGKWVLFFSHPSDFTPVCTTEFMTMASMKEEFRDMNVELLGLSVDSLYSHIAWIRKIEELEKFIRNIFIVFIDGCIQFVHIGFWLIQLIDCSQNVFCHFTLIGFKSCYFIRQTAVYIICFCQIWISVGIEITEPTLQKFTAASISAALHANLIPKIF